MLVAASAVVAASSAALVRFASGLEARAAARFLFAVRMFPAGAGLFAVLGLCIPSYLWLEPAGEIEDLGVACIAGAIAAAVLWIRSAARAGLAVLEVRRFIGECVAAGENLPVAGDAAWVVDRKRTMIAAGVIRPTVIISRDVVSALSPEQLEAAILHERAHLRSRDNWKRLAILAAPAIFSLKKIEQAWHRFTEWAADDAAVSRDRARALALAEALVRVARLGSEKSAALATPLLGEDFSARVERLVDGPAAPKRVLWKPAALAFAVAAGILLRPSTLEFVHYELEKLIR